MDAQITQTIRGQAFDRESQTVLFGVNVAVYKDSSLLGGSQTDAKGTFRIEKVPVGRVNVVASYLGYKKIVLTNVPVNSAKEVILRFDMDALVSNLKEVEVSGKRNGEVINEMALVSARGFSVDETNRYAGSRGDPARMASNFAGVGGTDDSRNDIVIRGNSPFGVVYRLDNLNIPNPNHFAIAGATGGSVGILNNKMLANSDFFTGAFPAEFGNATAGIFDIKYKNGNNEKHEFTAQFGALGAEVTAEGPIDKNKKSSYLINYRYATLELLVKMGIKIGTTAIPKYQDLQFKFNFPTKKGGEVSFFGLGGMSNINFIQSTEKKPNLSQDIYETNNVDEYFKAGLGIFGLSYTRPINDKTYSKITFGVSGEWLRNQYNRINRHTDSAGNYVLDSLDKKMNFQFITAKFSTNFFRNHKFNSRHSIRFGMYTDLYRYNMFDSVLNEQQHYFIHRLNYQGFQFLFQPYVQWKFNISDKLAFNVGLHLQYFTMSRSYSIEPRAAIKYSFKQNQAVSFGAGLHSQMQPNYIYLMQNTFTNHYNRLYNDRLDFDRSFQAVLSYDVFFKKDIRIKTELYFQYLFNIPVDTFASSFNILNQGDGFDRFFPNRLVNKGLGRNYGIEFTLEKFFTHNWFMLFTASVFDSKLTGSNGKWYNSEFDGNYIVNALGTKEFKWGKKHKNTVGIGGKITVGGGRRYTPIDTAASRTSEDAVYVDSLRNKFQFQPYFRFDIKLSYKLNSRKLSHEVGIDLVNLTGQKNLLRLKYVGGTDPVQKEYQLGFLPLFYYRIDF